MNKGEEYSAEVYRTGNDFAEDRRKDLEVISNGHSRGVTYEPDPSQLICIGVRRGVQDYQAELIQSYALESPDDRRYNRGLNNGGDAKMYNPQ